VSAPLPFGAGDDAELELAVVDLRVARALWEGVPTARLLARIRLDRDERDLVGIVERASGADLASSTWDKLMARLLGASQVAYERVKRAVARHGRAASDEGPLVANDSAIAALVHVLLSAAETRDESSPAEGAADGAAPDGAVLDGAVLRACGLLDERLAATGADRRAPAFEACLHIATIATGGAPSLAALVACGPSVASTAALYPWGDHDVPVAERRALLLDRAAAERAPSVARDLAALGALHGELVAFVRLEPRSSHEPQVVPPSSWLPTDLGTRDAASRLAAALERGATTAPRARSVILRGGDPALDAIGAEMLDAASHPFASAVFADILGRASRERDVVRLVSYFAIAPDVATAAHALATSTAREVPSVLRAWLASILPADLSRCVAALAPYPHLHAAAKPLLDV
jgi:hypothetical protein